MTDKTKCADCGTRGANTYLKDKWGQPDKRSLPRCAVCAMHHERNVAYKKRTFIGSIKADCQRRDAALTMQADRAPNSKVKVCPNCSARRRKDAFIKGSGMFGQCQLCRDIAAREARSVASETAIAQRIQERLRMANTDKVIKRLQDEINARDEESRHE